MVSEYTIAAAIFFASAASFSFGFLVGSHARHRKEPRRLSSRLLYDTYWKGRGPIGKVGWSDTSPGERDRWYAVAVVAEDEMRREEPATREGG